MKRASLLLAGMLVCPTLPATAQTSPITAVWYASLVRLLSGLRVDASQATTTADQTSTAVKSSASAAASTVAATRQGLLVAKARHNYSYETGTGYAACTVSLGLTDERDAGASATTVIAAFGAADRSWLQSGGDGAARLRASLDLRKTLYCSEAERTAGVCSGTGGYGAGDSDASPWLYSRNYGAEEITTAGDFLDVIAPLPTIEPAASTAVDQTRLVENRRGGALLSGARAALMTVIAAGTAGDERGTN
ncbi:hypothetical protein [Pinisolibacter aquiterrae]|uniref:hypothetical protein n=1 Tax=Pinisolibacter aquiterrae TaxID=2815579 RepID=UPI001C3E1E5D|nr:hypothetical protein [Pinisolibacter aquiterrae]MBV5266382.1 hypothetical protein [Pinisolibacter aquiterrae]MCC8235830.1 hypothetical protein [Pinisolibacter aquiterrae]